MEKSFTITTDEQAVTSAHDLGGKQEFEEALDQVNTEYAEVLKKLAE